jgi:hypothetical protein
MYLGEKNYRIYSLKVTHMYFHSVEATGCDVRIKVSFEKNRQLQYTSRQEYCEMKSRFLHIEDMENVQNYNISFLHRNASYEIKVIVFSVYATLIS